MSSLSNKKSEEDYCFGEFVFPSDSIIDVKYVDGKKEGKCKIVSKNNVLVAELNFHEDLLNGNSIFYNDNGEITKYYVFDNGIKSKYYTIEVDRMKEYIDDKLIYEGEYIMNNDIIDRNGKGVRYGGNAKEKGKQSEYNRKRT